MEEQNVAKRKITILAIAILFLFVSLICLTNTAYGAFTPAISSPAQTETTITLSWTKSNDWIFISYAVTYSISVNGPYHTVSTLTDQSQTSFAVDDLSPNTDYYFIVQDTASVILGTSTTPSNTLQARTKTNPQISITSRTSTTASLKWTDYNSYSSQVPFQSYVIQMSTSGGSWSTLTTITDVSQNTYTVTGLSPSTYDFRMYDKAGTSGQYESTSNIATLVINPPVQVQISSSATSVNVGQQVQLTASTSGGTNSYSYQWYSNGNPIAGATSASYKYTPTKEGTINIYATAQDTQDSYLAVATSNSISLAVTNPFPVIYIIIIIVVLVAVVVAVVGTVIKKKQKPSRKP